MPSLSIVLPAYNEEENVASAVEGPPLSFDFNNDDVDDVVVATRNAEIVALSGEGKVVIVDDDGSVQHVSDEAIPGWQNSDRFSRWPLWRGGGLILGPTGYRIYKFIDLYLF